MAEGIAFLSGLLIASLFIPILTHLIFEHRYSKIKWEKFHYWDERDKYKKLYEEEKTEKEVYRQEGELLRKEMMDLQTKIIKERENER